MGAYLGERLRSGAVHGMTSLRPGFWILLTEIRLSLTCWYKQRTEKASPLAAAAGSSAFHGITRAAASERGRGAAATGCYLYRPSPCPTRAWLGADRPQPLEAGEALVGRGGWGRGFQ